MSLAQMHTFGWLLLASVGYITQYCAVLHFASDSRWWGWWIAFAALWPFTVAGIYLVSM